MAEIRTEIESMQHNLEKEATTSPSIDANKATSIDVRPQTSQIPAKSESLVEKKDEWEIAYINPRINDVYNPLNNNMDWFSAMEDRLKSYEDMHDRFTSPIMGYLDTLSTQMMNVQRDIGKLNDQHDLSRRSGLDSQAEWLQKEVKVIQRQLASQHQISATIDRAHSKSIDNTKPATIEHLVASIDTTSTPDDEKLIQNKVESMHKELNELSAYAYSKIGWHQSSIEDIQERLQNISNEIQKLDERWTRNDEATRTYAYSKIGWHQSSIEDIQERLQNISNEIQKLDERWTRNDEATRNLLIEDSTKMLKWINSSTIHTCLDCLKEPKLTSNTKPDIIACLGAWTQNLVRKNLNRTWRLKPLRLAS
ncbi:hypothetical protein F2Q68_00034537 [Brassica cretica]|uniref:Uncharacterized protein n=1 Tax=Brassica cretica TaxID=69181 RepID=A0A8S9HB42_BRACR|nr:hypothetical protein F2Q68_00034537 [Brassica cretica]